MNQASKGVKEKEEQEGVNLSHSCKGKSNSPAAYCDMFIPCLKS